MTKRRHGCPEKTARNKKILELYERDNLTYIQIAEKFGISKHRVYSIISREMDRALVARINANSQTALTSRYEQYQDFDEVL